MLEYQKDMNNIPNRDKTLDYKHTNYSQ